MNTLELFAGSRSFSKVAKKLGHNVYTTDSESFDKIDVVCDILHFNPYKLPYKPDIIWASPPCTFFSVASIGKHWNKDHTPKTEQAKLGLHIIRRTILIIKVLKPKILNFCCEHTAAGSDSPCCWMVIAETFLSLNYQRCEDP